MGLGSGKVGSNQTGGGVGRNTEPIWSLGRRNEFLGKKQLTQWRDIQHHVNQSAWETRQLIIMQSLGTGCGSSGVKPCITGRAYH